MSVITCWIILRFFNILKNCEMAEIFAKTM